MSEHIPSAAELVAKAGAILADNEELKRFAVLNKIGEDTARALLEKLLRDPVASPEAEKYVFSDQAAPELKGYYAGEEKGYVRGHEAGFAKGAAIGVLGTIGLGILAVGSYVLARR